MTSHKENRLWIIAGAVAAIFLVLQTYSNFQLHEMKETVLEIQKDDEGFELAGQSLEYNGVITQRRKGESKAALFARHNDIARSANAERDKE